MDFGLGIIICLAITLMFALTVLIIQNRRIKQLEDERMENRKDLAQYAHLAKSGKYEMETKNGAITGLKEIIKYLEDNK